MLPPAIIFEPKKKNYSNDFGRNIRLNLNDNRVNDYGYNSFINYETDKSELGILGGRQVLNLNDEKRGFKVNNKNRLKTTNKETYVKNNYIPTKFENKGNGYTRVNYVAKPTFKEISTERLFKDGRMNGRTRVQTNSGKESLHIKHKLNKLSSEREDERVKYRTNNSQIISGKSNMGKVLDRNHDLSRLENNRMDSDIIKEQLKMNPFVLNGTVMKKNPFRENFIE